MITVMKTDRQSMATFRGILIRPSNSSISGTFSVDDSLNFQTLANGECITHNDNNDKMGTFVYYFDSKDKRSRPELEVMLLTDYSTFYMMNVK